MLMTHTVALILCSICSQIAANNRLLCPTYQETTDLLRTYWTPIVCLHSVSHATLRKYHSSERRWHAVWNNSCQRSYHPLQQAVSCQGCCRPLKSAAWSLCRPAHSCGSWSPTQVVIDRDGPSFRYVLDYLRNNGQVVPPHDLHAAKQLLQEATYYEQRDLVSVMQQQISGQEQPAGQQPQARQPLQAPFPADLPRPVGPTAACQSAILEAMRASQAGNNNLDDGLHQDRICAMLAGQFNRAMVIAALRDLTDDALIYNTFDDYHFKVT